MEEEEWRLGYHEWAATEPAAASAEISQNRKPPVDKNVITIPNSRGYLKIVRLAHAGRNSSKRVARRAVEDPEKHHLVSGREGKLEAEDRETLKIEKKDHAGRKDS